MEFKQCNNDLIKIESENFNITIKTTFKKSQLEKSVIDDKITELRNIFATILSENQKLQDKKLLEKLLEKSINIVNSIDAKEDTKDFIEEVIHKMIVQLLNIKSETDNKCDSINIELHNKKPYELFTNILPSIIGLNYNLSVTTNLNKAQCTYNNGKINITMDDNCRNNIIIKADNFIKECEFEHKGFLSHRFRIKTIKTMTKMSNKVPQLSKIAYDIGNKIANFENE